MQTEKIITCGDCGFMWLVSSKVTNTAKTHECLHCIVDDLASRLQEVESLLGL